MVRYPQVVSAQIGKCMAGLLGPKSGLPVKKPTESWASDAFQVRPWRPLQCDGLHGHANIDGSNRYVPQDRAKDMARWPQPLCRRIANGCGEVLHRDRYGKQSLALPLLTPADASQNCPDEEIIAKCPQARC